MSPSRSGRLRVAGLGVLGGACLVAAGAITFAFVYTTELPPSLDAADAVTTAPVTQQEFYDELAATAVVSRAPDSEIHIRSAGMATSVTCQAGTVLDSGASNISIDGQPLLNLHTNTPLWRDLGPGDSGKDVESLKAALRAAGFATTEGTKLRAGDMNAVQSMFSKAGLESDFWALSPTDIIWLPSPSVVAASCEISAGDTVEPDAVVATIEGEASVSLTGLEAANLEGARTLQVDDVEGVLTDDLALPPETTALLLATPSYQGAKREAGEKSSVSIPVRLRLQTPAEVAALPPSAIRVTDDGTSCVGGTDHSTIRVQVVSSELGRTIVLFPDLDTPPAVSITPPASCA